MPHLGTLSGLTQMPDELCLRILSFNRVLLLYAVSKSFRKFLQDFRPFAVVKVRKSDNFRQNFDTLVNKVQLLTLKFSTHRVPCERDFLYSLSKSPMLTKLKFSQVDLENPTARLFCEGLQSLPHLQDLALKNNHLNPQTFSAVALALMLYTKIKRLSVECNQVGKIGAVCLRHLLRNKPEFEKLKFVFTTIPRKEEIKIFRVLESCSNFKTIVVSGKFVHMLLKSVPKLRELRKMSFVRAIMPIPDMKRFLHALQSCTKISHLNLSRSDDIGRGVKYVAKTIQELPQLTQLELRRCKILKQGIEVLCGALPACTELMVLDLAENSMCDACADEVVHALGSMPKLRAVDLSQNSLSETTQFRIVQELRALHNLLRVKL